jgi:pre-rRNA-processing protein IPI1
VQPLLLDSSAAVRAHCVKFLAALPPACVRDSAEDLLLYARVAATHLSARIQLTGLDVLEWLLGVAGREVVGCAGGWVKTLNCLLAVLGWKGITTTQKGNAGWQSTGVMAQRASLAEDAGILRTRQLQVLSLLLEKGLMRPDDKRREEWIRNAQRGFPYFMFQDHAIPKKRNPYGYLNLFGPPRDEESEQYEDPEERARVFVKLAARDLHAGLEKAKLEGGGIGRAAMSIERGLHSCVSLDEL